ncbi:Gag-pro-like protein [Gossypium australe]|uniref:Gag-pro-like protein n=1 Tax=Gossypium australe TaxID=47621 RepID=A0A5B6UI63_9ROSI|nr:Gag-pro-like protein [Gossypium australe]
MQKEMQDQLQVQLQEQLAKVQQEMRDQILESQRSMVNQLAQLLAEEREKGKGPTANSEDDNEDPTYLPGFTLIKVQAQPDVYPQRAPVAIKPQQYQVGTSAPMNYQIGSGSNPGDNPTNPVVSDLDDVTETEKVKAKLPKQLEDRCRWLEEKFKAMENADYHCKIDAKDLSLVPDLVLPLKFKTPEFEKYNGTSYLVAHISMFCRRMTGYVNNDQLLIHCFQDSLIGSAAKWYNQLSRAQVTSWKDLAQAFMKQYSYVTDMTPDRLTLQNMEKKQNESFRQYAQRWREVATQVQPPLLEKETTMLFINTLKAPFINHMLGSATKSFLGIVMSGGLTKRVYKANHPVVTISRPISNENGVQMAPRVIIQKPVAFLYKDSNKVPWNYDCNVTILGEESPISASEEGREVGFYTRNEKRYTGAEPVKGKTHIAEQKGEKTVRSKSPVKEPVTENEEREFLKFLKYTGAVPSSLHQKLKLVTEGQLVTINAEEDIITSVTSDVPYVGTDDEALECSFRSLEFVNATFTVEWNKILVPKISKTTRMGLQLTVGKGALPGRGLDKCLPGKVEAPMLKDK